MEKSDFKFIPSGYGHYRVVYTNPKSGKIHIRTINNMSLIDKTKNEEEPKKKDLFALRTAVIL